MITNHIFLQNNTAFITCEALVDFCKISLSTISHGLNKVRWWQGIEYPNDRRIVLVNYHTMKPEHQQLVKATITNGKEPIQFIAEQTQLQSLPDAIQQHVSILELSNLQLKYGVHKANHIAQAAAACKFITSIQSAADAKKYGFASKSDLMIGVMNHLAECGNLVFKCSNLVVLRRKLVEFKTAGTNAFIHKNIGNKNREEFGDLQRAAFIKLAADGRKFNIAQLYDQYSYYAKQQGWALISESRLRQIYNEPAFQNIISPFREGWKSTHELDMVINRLAPSFADAMWVLDGSPFELYYLEANKLKRLYWFYVIDAFSWKVVGYSIGETETSELVFQAVKSACINHNCLPYQLQMDNGSSLKNGSIQSWFKKLAHYVTPAAVGNARAKVAEPLWAHFRDGVLRYYPNHSGGNITAKKKGTHVNPDYIKANAKQYPSKAELVEVLHKTVAIWNNKAGEKREAPAAKYASSTDRKRTLTFDQQINLFWLWRKQGIGNKARMLPYTYKNDGLEVIIDGTSHWYLVGEDSKEIAAFFHNNIHKQFWVKYDPECLDAVAIYEQADHEDNAKFVAMAKAKALVPMAIADYEAGSGNTLHKYLEVQKSQADYRSEGYAEAERLLEAHGILKGAVSIDDIHKDALNAAEAEFKSNVAKGFMQDEPMKQRRKKELVPVLVKKQTFKSIYESGNEGGLAD